VGIKGLKMGLLEVDITLQPRWKNETYYINEFITPETYMVQKLANELAKSTADETAWELFRWVVEQVEYPIRAGIPEALLVFCDFHLLFRHPFTPKLSAVLFDYWKFPVETLRDLKGDCEDTSMLLTSLLRALNLPAYCVIGEVVIDGVPYGHAWVIYDHCKYGWVILESTLDSLDPYPNWDEYYRVVKQVEDIYKPRIIFNEKETYAYASLKSIKKLLPEATVKVKGV